MTVKAKITSIAIQPGPTCVFLGYKSSGITAKNLNHREIIKSYPEGKKDDWAGLYIAEDRATAEGYLPDSILWRQKEQFSDGVGYGWIDGLKAHAEAHVSDREFVAAASRFPINPPQSREAYFYRRIFEQLFPGAACAGTVPGGKSIACSSPAAIAWDAAFAEAADPSGRAVAGVHQAALA